MFRASLNAPFVPIAVTSNFNLTQQQNARRATPLLKSTPSAHQNHQTFLNSQRPITTSDNSHQQLNVSNLFISPMQSGVENPILKNNVNTPALLDSATQNEILIPTLIQSKNTLHDSSLYNAMSTASASLYSKASSLAPKIELPILNFPQPQKGYLYNSEAFSNGALSNQFFKDFGARHLNLPLLDIPPSIAKSKQADTDSKRTAKVIEKFQILDPDYNILKRKYPEEVKESNNNLITEEFHDYDSTPLQNELCRGIQVKSNLATHSSGGEYKPSIQLDTDWLHNKDSAMQDLDQMLQMKQNGKGFKKLPPLITRCPHTDEKHYAKQMCSRCYHKIGRTKLAWMCKHKNRMHYARGKCQSCYLGEYLKITNRRENKRSKDQSEKRRSQIGIQSDFIALKDDQDYFDSNNHGGNNFHQQKSLLNCRKMH